MELDGSIIDNEDNVEDTPTSEQNTPVSSEDAGHSEDLDVSEGLGPFEDEGASEDEGPALESIKVVDPSIDMSVNLPQTQTPDEQSSDTAAEKKRKKPSKKQITLSVFVHRVQKKRTCSLP